MCIEDAGRALNNQAMQIIGADRFGERFPQTVQEIEDQSFLDLNLLLGLFELPDTTGLP